MIKKLQDIKLPKAKPNVVRGFKAMRSDMTCRGFQFELGKTYTFDGEPALCVQGFHFCRELVHCFEYYIISPIHTRLFEIEAWGIVKDSSEYEDHKSVTNNIKIIREIPFIAAMKMSNSNINNLGINNSGLENRGNSNSGPRNVGSRNSGALNMGSANSGNINIGHRNIGNGNTGYENTGSFNLGSHNAGSFNVGNYNSGYFNFGNIVNKGAYSIFNVIIDPKNIFIPAIPNWLYVKLTEWVPYNEMSKEEKLIHKMASYTNGYLKAYDLKDKIKESYYAVPESDRALIENFPGYTHEKFYKLFGIDRTQKEIDFNQ